MVESRALIEKHCGVLSVCQIKVNSAFKFLIRMHSEL